MRVVEVWGFSRDRSRTGDRVAAQGGDAGVIRAVEEEDLLQH